MKFTLRPPKNSSSESEGFERLVNDYLRSISYE